MLLADKCSKSRPTALVFAICQQVSIKCTWVFDRLRSIELASFPLSLPSKDAALHDDPTEGRVLRSSRSGDCSREGNKDV